MIKNNINSIPWKLVFNYFKGDLSLFRHFQNLFLERNGKSIKGSITEIGCEKQYRHEQYFPNVDNYVCSNIGRDFDVYLDITNNELPDNSVENYLCISVLQHVFDTQKAFDEIHRTLVPGGKLLLVVPFAYPVHDVVDYWRFSPNSFDKLLKDFELLEFTHLGGVLSATADFLKRPKKRINKRYFLYKSFGFFMIIFAKFFDTLDSMPLGFGIVAEKTNKILPPNKP
jgi:SAM-dependent methyltransferase